MLTEAVFSGQGFLVHQSHAWIVWGGTGEKDRLDLSFTLAAAHVCSGGDRRPCMSCRHCVKSARRIHPDITVIEKQPDKKAVSVEQIRALRSDAAVAPNEADGKVFIIRGAGLMNAQAQNALLQLLEEPPAGVCLILESETPSQILPTIRSRCAEVSAERGIAASSAESDDTASAFCRALDEGPLKLAELSFRLEGLDRDDFAAFIDSARAHLVRRIADRLGAGDRAGAFYLERAVKLLERARGYLLLNVGLGHISGMICAGLLIRNEEEDGRGHQRPFSEQGKDILL